MLKRLMRIKVAMLALALTLTNLPVIEAQSVPSRTFPSIPISTYRDDPFVRAADVERQNTARFGVDENRRLTLWGNTVWLSEEDLIYRRDSQTGIFKPFAWNPWPVIKSSNQQGDFKFQEESRFPLFTLERDADGKPILKDGFQVWTPNDLHLGDTTTFEAANAAKDAAETWAGRYIPWGVNGVLKIEPHVFIDFNAFYSPSARELFFGVVPYRLPGETSVKIFETATSWEMAAHESGHALHAALKPNIYHGIGFAVWGESFGDQTAMWASLQNPERLMRLLAETNGNLRQSNSLSSMSEAFGFLTNTKAMRDAFNDLKISDTSEEVHDRSETLTGAAYKIFLAIYEELKQQFTIEEALRKAGNIMGSFLMRSTDYTPENEMTLEEVAKAYLKVDKEFFGSRYHNVLVDEFVRREIFDANSEREWLIHEDSLPYICLYPQSSDQDVEALLRSNLDILGIGQDFGLKLQSMTRGIGLGQTIVRAQLTLGRYDGAPALDNHCILVFRADGLLADYHTALQPYPSLRAMAQIQEREAVQIRSLISQAKRLRLDKHGAPLSIVRKADGQLTIESHVLRGTGLNTWMEVFTPDNPKGERREVLLSPLPPDKRIPIPNDILN